ncbi:winged helix-turn-helix domain-containing protein [Halomarina oriensis]|uniref:Helix-turn-helix domain-containing protein n=1 Tax=Halomarina oriensis TaxID=671145 RepID=A0A6B0GIQ4_9EURY|nr:helix-turn-helix domain-containing protein [Halomarina oriensis]MWG34634.1 helix-turn-helix domain-containing protein [Halomarina oriensis]
MTADSGRETTSALSPDDAFGVLGDETRLDILQTLGAAERPLAYSELFERVEYDDASNFSYHLDKLVGHFVRKRDEGYDLWEAGRRVVEAVLAGAVTDTPVVEPTRVDERCPYCGAPIEVGFQHARVEMNCTECPGFMRHARSQDRRFTDYGTLGFFLFPPAGIRGRTADGVLEAAWTWRHADFLVASTGVCSRCSAPLDHSVTVCTDHDASAGYCELCEHRYAVQFHTHCRNCNRTSHLIAPGCLLATTELLAFFTEHGINPPGSRTPRQGVTVAHGLRRGSRLGRPVRGSPHVHRRQRGTHPDRGRRPLGRRRHEAGGFRIYRWLSPLLVGHRPAQLS